ncbi:EamA family transporter [Nesterenkonia sp.]|uniref:EamA family transporter n=1 Tax=Nesterenkonia sp. TaxID=704201 RepID=UPI002606DAC0|nr:EamA family transporter [Nesterenkonia sp.]
MPIRHVLLAVVVAVLWGVNFVAIHFALEQFPPLFLVALRFAVLALPALLFVPWAGVKIRYLIGYGLGFGTLQFFGLFLGMAAGFPAGLASLVLQASAPFTVLLGALLLREQITGRRAVGVAVAVTGLAVVGISRGSLDGWGPFLLVVLGAFGWALGNLASRKAQTDKPLALVMWMTVVPPLPMLALSLMVEGPETIGEAMTSSLSADALPSWLGFVYLVLMGTVVGAGIWVWLMRRHPAGAVAPFSMLVPIFGVLAAWLVLGQVPSWLELAGGALVIWGVLFSSSTAGRALRRRRPG